MTSSLPWDALYARTVPEPRRWIPRPARYEFAVAYPDPETLPLEELAEATASALREEGRDLALYPPPLGHAPLRAWVAEKLARERGMEVSPEQVLLTAGSMQAIALVLELLLDPEPGGDLVFTEAFTYLGTLRALRRFRAEVVGIPCDAHGMRPDALEQALQRARQEGRRPKLIYTIPTFNNPLGTVLPLERRRDLVRLAHTYGVPILEDDCYVDLALDGPVPPAIRALPGGAEVTLYTGSFSKLVAPGMRLGWVVAPPEVVERLLALKLDAGTGTFAAMAVHRFLRKHYPVHLGRLRAALRKKRDAMLSALGEHLGPRARVVPPSGGMYLWVELPEGVDTETLLPKARERGVGYYPGHLFSPEGAGRHCLRLCFAYPSLDDIREGIAVLGRLLAEEGL